MVKVGDRVHVIEIAQEGLIESRDTDSAGVITFTVRMDNGWILRGAGDSQMELISEDAESRSPVVCPECGASSLKGNIRHASLQWWDVRVVDADDTGIYTIQIDGDMDPVTEPNLVRPRVLGLDRGYDNPQCAHLWCYQCSHRWIPTKPVKDQDE